MNILMVTSEAVPFAKTGGLADAVPALSAALSKAGHDVRLVMPLYRLIDRGEQKNLLKSTSVRLGDGEYWFAVREGRLPDGNVPVYFLERDDLYDRDGIYGPDGSHSWGDNARRYAFLSAASLALSRALNWEPDIVHAHDWPTGPLPLLLRQHQQGGHFRRTRSVISIHNLGYQGIFAPQEMTILPLDRQDVDNHWGFTNGGLNFLAMGLASATMLSTVSPTYAREILNPDMAQGLHELLLQRAPQTMGILNGMDYEDWNPSRDPALGEDTYERYQMAGKGRMKNRLQEEFRLPQRPELPLFGLIARLTGQKGIDLLTDDNAELEQMLTEGTLQIVILGSGERRYENTLKAMAETHPDNVAIKIAFDPALSRRVEAGSDFFLMPSRYEPCGLNQMYSLRYGTLPVVRRTGGLADTVLDVNEDSRHGNGFVFDEANPRALAHAMSRAVDFMKQGPRALTKIRRRSMAIRFDWRRSAKDYENLYRQALRIPVG